MLRCPGIQTWLVKSPVRARVRVSWGGVLCGVMAVLWHGAVRSVSPVYSHRAETQESRWLAGQSSGREEAKHETAMQAQQSETRWKKLLATQAKPQSTGAKTERSQDANNHIDWRNDLVTSRRESRGFIEGWLLEWIHLVLPVEGDLAHMHTHRTDMGRDTGGIIQTGKYKTHTHTQGRRQGCHDEIMTGGIRGAEG